MLDTWQTSRLAELRQFTWINWPILPSPLSFIHIQIYKTRSNMLADWIASYSEGFNTCKVIIQGSRPITPWKLEKSITDIITTPRTLAQMHSTTTKQSMTPRKLSQPQSSTYHQAKCILNKRVWVNLCIFISFSNKMYIWSGYSIFTNGYRGHGLKTFSWCTFLNDVYMKTKLAHKTWAFEMN